MRTVAKPVTAMVAMKIAKLRRLAADSLSGRKRYACMLHSIADMISFSSAEGEGSLFIGDYRGVNFCYLSF